MKNAFRAALVGVAMAMCAVAAQTAAHADVIRIALVTADSQADFENNAALLPEYAALLKKGGKDISVFADASKMMIGTSSVWPSEAEVKAVTESAEWKAIVAKQKAKALNIGIYQVK